MRKATTVAVGGGGGGGKGAATTTTTTDLLVCFPARQRLALMPKPICSPSRSTMDKAAAAARRRSQTPGALSSPMFRGSKANRTARGGDDDEEEDEPQSPKVTCAGQIKVGRPRKAAAARKLRGKGGGGGGKSWITVVEEIERAHGRRKKVGWLEAVGIRRDALPFLGGVVRSIRHKVRCLGSLHGAADSSTDDDGDDAEEEHGSGGTAGASVFSKWLMVLEGGEEPLEQDSRDDDEERDREDHEERQSGEADECSSAPPPNALLLMRCRSAPAKGLSRRGTAEPPAGEAEEAKGGAEDAGTEEDRDDLVFMSTAPGFLKLSIDIAKETWIVGGTDPLSRSRSWKR